MEVFLFPLVNVTLFPSTTKPLHIFEPRYLEMVHQSIESSTPIAIGYIEDPTQVVNVQAGEVVPFVREVAGYGHPQIVEERINGSLLIFLRGQGKARLGAVKHMKTPYIVCEASEIPENNVVETDQLKTLENLHRVLLRWVDKHIPDQIQREIFVKSLSGAVETVGAFAAYMIRDYDLQQMVLEYNDINEKIDFLHRLFESGELTNT